MLDDPEITPHSEGWKPAGHNMMDGISRWTRDGDLLVVGMGDALSNGEGSPYAAGRVRLYRFSEPARHFDEIEEALRAANEPRRAFKVQFSLIPAAVKRKK
ncbi:hypothetical protein [Salipiger mucosus]|uniref:Uncharacterized protein n=1 Tax=Salipiger mucosus DSM 16094 TaxID=1123237 RepID=S9QYS4_9RHOB|nr:hypothetical protein [Salipiger mucosus]EPX84742.1 hypothetical protein Salmuc_01315 [Salipiger mucosus DSM 16094]